MKTITLKFLVSATSWDEVKDLFRSDLNMTKDKKDDGVSAIKGHFIVLVDFKASELTDEFYDKVSKSEKITILRDPSSDERSLEILNTIRPIELKLRELATYAHGHAEKYYDAIKMKHVFINEITDKKKIIDSDIIDPVVSFFDFGELISFLGKTGNIVDTKDISDKIVYMAEQSKDFDVFKRTLIEKFKKLTIWDIISEKILDKETPWDEISPNLDILKDKRNTAAHFRIATPSDLEDVIRISKSILPILEVKPDPDTDRLQSKLDSVIRLEKLNELSSEYIDRFEAERSRVLSEQIDRFKRNMADSQNHRRHNTLPPTSLEEFRIFLNNYGSEDQK